MIRRSQASRAGSARLSRYHCPRERPVPAEPGTGMAIGLARCAPTEAGGVRPGPGAALGPVSGAALPGLAPLASASTTRCGHDPWPLLDT